MKIYPTPFIDLIIIQYLLNLTEIVLLSYRKILLNWHDNLLTLYEKRFVLAHDDFVYIVKKQTFNIRNINNNGLY